MAHEHNPMTLRCRTCGAQSDHCGSYVSPECPGGAPAPLTDREREMLAVLRKIEYLATGAEIGARELRAVKTQIAQVAAAAIARATASPT